jgi:hypothetical protein
MSTGFFCVNKCRLRKHWIHIGFLSEFTRAGHDPRTIVYHTEPSEECSESPVLLFRALRNSNIVQELDQ